MQPDQLPALPPPTDKMYWLGYNDDDMRSYALIARADERARADALQAELARITADRDAKTERMWELGKQADALEAALKRLVQAWDKLPARRYSLPTDVSDWLQIHMQPCVNAARALIEPTKG